MRVCGLLSSTPTKRTFRNNGMISAKECCRRPQNRRLAVKVARDSGPVQIKLQIVGLVSATANVANITIRLEVAHERQPSLPCRGAIDLCIKPAFLYPGYHRESEHARA